MSLKAKLEAVIYAAEEPVTLNQLALLFADEVLEWRAEREKVAAEASTTTSATEPLPLLTEAFDYLELEQADGATLVEEGAILGEEPSAESQVQTSATDENSAVETLAEVGAEPPASESTDADLEASSGATADPSADPTPEEAAKQAARQREREIRLGLRELLDELIQDYAVEGSGIEIREIAGGYRMATKAEYHDAVRAFVKSLKPAMKLSLPALETLAVIAYKQPVTAPEVNEIRGVESSGVFGSLLARKLIATAGRKQVVGRPILYKTTKEFLLRFGLKDLAELPSMEEFEKMAASEFEETEAAGAEPESAGAEETEQGSLSENPSEPESTNESESTIESGVPVAVHEAADATEEVVAEAPTTTLE